MSIVLWIILTPFALWIAWCILIWGLWVIFDGSGSDTSGDAGLAVLAFTVGLPYVLYIIVQGFVLKLFRKEN
jgi:hypothetical protein